MAGGLSVGGAGLVLLIQLMLKSEINLRILVHVLLLVESRLQIHIPLLFESNYVLVRNQSVANDG